MLKFLLICALMTLVVELLVRFIIQPLIKSSDKKVKLEESKTSGIDPTFRLASETMYDGGKPHPEQDAESAHKNENISNNNTVE